MISTALRLALAALMCSTGVVYAEAEPEEIRGTQCGEVHIIRQNGMLQRTGGGDPSTCKELNLKMVKLESLHPEVFKGMTGLQELTMWGCTLKTIPAGVFDDLTGLRKLFLGGNDIERIDSALFRNLRSLEFLDLLSTEAVVAAGDSVFEGLTSLKKLYIGMCGYETISEKLLAPLVNLEYLSLGSNDITDIAKGAFRNNKKLQTLSLGKNQLTAFSEEHLGGITNLEEVYLQENPLRCCDLPKGLNDKGYTSMREHCPATTCKVDSEKEAASDKVAKLSDKEDGVKLAKPDESLNKAAAAVASEKDSATDSQANATQDGDEVVEDDNEDLDGGLDDDVLDDIDDDAEFDALLDAAEAGEFDEDDAIFDADEVVLTEDIKATHVEL